ncbi:hypothetical protein OSJ57_23310 [Sphingomonas sp. HH69]
MSGANMSVADFIEHVAECSRGIAFGAGVGEMESAGQIISYLAAHPDKFDAFIEGGTFAWPLDWFENGCLSWHAMNGRIVRPEEARAARAAKRDAQMTITRAPTRTIADLSDDERRVIRARHRGWESASEGLLAHVFRVPVQAIVAVLREG